MRSTLSIDNEINQSISKSHYRSEINGLRAMAVVAVIINHFNKKLLPSGYLGVDIFFLISGFVIMSSVSGHASRNLGNFLVEFYIRRVKRLAPALILFVLTQSSLICLFDPLPQVSLTTGMKSLFGLSNLYLLEQSTDYFADSTTLNVFTHTWSLGVEQQFYVLFPFLTWLTGFSRQSAKGARNLFWVTVALLIASLIGFISLYSSNQSAAYFLMLTRLWEMSAGCLLFLGLQHSNRFICGVKNLPPAAVTIAIIAVLFIPLQFAVFSTVAVVMLSAILIACLRPETPSYNLFTRQSIVYIGLISYSLYLWHWGVLSLSRWTIGIHWWTVPFQVAVILLLAVVSYRYVETPLRQAQWSAVRWRNLAYGIVALIIAALVITGLSTKLYSKLFLDKPAFASRIAAISPQNASWNEAACTTDRASSRAIGVNFDQCNILESGRSQLDKKHLFWYGDSYAGQLSLVLSVISNEAQLPTNLFTALGCPASQFASTAGETEKGYCSGVFRKYLAYFLGKSKAGDVLVLNNAFHYWKPEDFLIDPEGGLNFQNGTTSFKHYVQEITQLSDELKQKGRRLALVSDIPVLYRNPNICSYWFAQMNNECTSEELINVKANEYRRSVSNTIQSNHHFNQKGGFLDIYTPTRDLLSYAPDNYAEIYRDKAHLSKIGALRLKNSILAFLRQNQLLS
jgi:peptidoglycan/LPS O-acetylase OafA/YrhL